MRFKQKEKWEDMEFEEDEEDESNDQEDEEDHNEELEDDQSEDDDDSEAEIYKDKEQANTEENVKADADYIPTKEDKQQFTSTLMSIRSSIDEINKKISTAITTLPTDKAEMKYGISYYESKNNLMLLYLSSLTLFFIHRLNDRNPIDKNPLMKKLIYLKTLMEKSKIIDLKLKPQIDRLVKLADKDETKETNEETDYKPRILNEDNVDEEEDKNSSNEDEAQMNDKEKKKIKYEVQKNMIEFFETTTDNKKRKKKIESAKEKIRNSEYLRKIKEEFSENPNEINSYNTQLEKYMKEVENYEEENFQRLKIPKREIKKLRKKDRDMDDLANIGKEYRNINKVLFEGEREEVEQQTKFLKGKRAIDQTLNSYLANKRKGNKVNNKKR